VLHPASGAAPSLAGSLPFNTADTALAMRLQQAREAERAALARELHDELGAILTAARLDVAWLEMQPAATQGAVAERLKRLRALLSDGIDFKRRVVEDLRVVSLAGANSLALQCCQVELAKEVESLLPVIEPDLHALGMRLELDLRQAGEQIEARLLLIKPLSPRHQVQRQGEPVA
jgi:signal transduction histidine kinase